VDYSPDLNPTEFSLSFWAKVEGGQGTKRSVVTSQNINGTTEGYAVYVNDQDVVLRRPLCGSSTHDGMD